MFKTDQDTLARALACWGNDVQITVAIEECSELITSLCHRARGRETHIASEIADVIIMMHQLALIFGVDDVQCMVDEKLERLRYRLADAPRQMELGE